VAAKHLTHTIRLAGDGRRAIARVRAADRALLEKHVFQRYPHREWGTFFRFGWTRTPWGVAVNYVGPLLPEAGDLDRQTDLTTFREQYSHRAFHAAAGPDRLGVGVVHSHPAGYATSPSPLDDDMDEYFAREFAAYSGGAPYCTLILERNDSSGLSFSGRVYDRGEWLPVAELLTVGPRLERQSSALLVGRPDATAGCAGTTERLQSLMGAASARRLRGATVGVVGCSGTGSPAVHVLARAGVGGFVLVDPERLSASNLERVHGSYQRHLTTGGELPFKVDLMREMIAEVNPAARVTSFIGNVLHENVVHELLRCDLVLGCVDTYHGRVALGDLASHHLLPSIDVGIAMNGKDGRVTEQVIDVTRFGPDLPCAFCRDRVDPAELAQELMSDEEREHRQRAAAEAAERGGDPDQYWRNRPRQLHTVGYLTTVAGAAAAGYAEGWLTGAFEPPHDSFQFDIGCEKLGCVTPPQVRKPGCRCGLLLGWGDAARTYRNVTLPRHWTPRAVLRFRS
jgi:tRNA A37 threonylcarbamoyladenosine dehydratase